MASDERPDCTACTSFFVTHDSTHPWGCNAFEIKSRALPSIAVRASSGSECRAFAPKPERRPTSPRSDDPTSGGSELSSDAWG